MLLILAFYRRFSRSLGNPFYFLILSRMRLIEMSWPSLFFPSNQYPGSAVLYPQSPSCLRMSSS